MITTKDFNNYKNVVCVEFGTGDILVSLAPNDNNSLMLSKLDTPLQIGEGVINTNIPIDSAKIVLSFTKPESISVLIHQLSALQARLLTNKKSEPELDFSYRNGKTDDQWFNTTWDYNPRWWYTIEGFSQRDWNQTLLTLIDQMYNHFLRDKDCGFIKPLLVNNILSVPVKFKSLFESLECYEKATQQLSSRFQIMFHNINKNYIIFSNLYKIHIKNYIPEINNSKIGEYRLIPKGQMVWSIGLQSVISFDEDKIIKITNTCIDSDQIFGTIQLVLFNFPGFIPSIHETKNDVSLSYNNTESYILPGPKINEK